MLWTSRLRFYETSIVKQVAVDHSSIYEYHSMHLVSQALSLIIGTGTWDLVDVFGL